MFTLRYSQECKVVRWDWNSWVDCSPSEADSVQDDIIELASSLSVKPTLFKDMTYDNFSDKKYQLLPGSLRLSELPTKGPRATEWTLDAANKKAKRVCQEAIVKSRKDHEWGDLRHAKSVYDEYKEKGHLENGGNYEGLYDLENPKTAKENYFGEEKPEAISWGDETVTDDMCTTSGDGALAIVATTALLADPYGAEMFNVVQLTIKVEVVPPEEQEEGSKVKDPTSSPVRKKAKETEYRNSVVPGNGIVQGTTY